MFINICYRSNVWRVGLQNECVRTFQKKILKVFIYTNEVIYLDSGQRKEEQRKRV